MIFDVANDRGAPTINAQGRSPCKASALLTHMNDAENPREAAASVPQADLQVKVWNPEISERKRELFWKKVDKGPNPKGCWNWTASKKCEFGYGGFSLVTGQSIRAHRISYVLCVGPVPAGLCVLHACDNPACVNPGHLWLGTCGDNNRDREAKGRGRQVGGDLHGTKTHPESVRRGALSGGRKNAIVTEDQARDIKNRYSSVRGVCRDLAKEYGVHKNVVYKIGNGLMWKEI